MQRDDLEWRVLLHRLARQVAFGTIKLFVDDFAEPLSGLVREDVARKSIAARVSNLPGQCLLVFNNLRRVRSWLQGRQRGFYGLLHLDVRSHAVEKGFEITRRLTVLGVSRPPGRARRDKRQEGKTQEQVGYPDFTLHGFSRTGCWRHTSYALILFADLFKIAHTPERMRTYPLRKRGRGM